MRILLTGRDGQVGSALAATLGELGHVWATSRRELDLERPDAIAREVRSYAPDLIVNAAAYTAVDRAESEPERCFAVNATAPAVLAEEASRRGAGIVHYSTDYVFDGRKDGPYVETDPTGPLGVYGRSKEAGEVAIRDSGAAHLVLRVAWVYGGSSRNFLTTMLGRFRSGEPVSVVYDEYGAPTWCRDIASATVRALLSALGGEGIDRAADPASALRDRGGLYHLAPTGVTSRYGFARAIAALTRGTRADPDGLASVVPIPSSRWESAADRPCNSQLDATRLERDLDVRIGPWCDRLKACLAQRGILSDREASSPAAGPRTPASDDCVRPSHLFSR